MTMISKRRTIGTHRVAVLLILFLSRVIYAADSLPFIGTRGGEKQKHDDDEQHYVQILDVNGNTVAEKAATKRPIKEKEIVQAFFENQDGSSEQLQQLLKARASNLTQLLVSTRRTLHQHPELMYQEQETSAIVQAVLNKFDINYTTGWAINANPGLVKGTGGYGVITDIGSGGLPCVLLRADMDALPILERTLDIDDYKSKNEGIMHACGHDGHITMLLGAAIILKEMEPSIRGTVRLIFQPAEEGGAGAKRMREEGILEMEPKPQHAFGLHVWPTLPSGSIASRSGPLLAAADQFEVLVAGMGGHAAMPHLTIDPIVTASNIVMNLQTLVSRNMNPLESGVVSVTKIDGGDAFNVIPASVLMRGTIRALSTEALLALQAKVVHIISSSAAMYGCNVTITWSPDYYPPTVNDPELFDSFSKHVGALVSDEGFLRNVDPTMGAEDFSFIAEALPSTFFLLGQGSGKNPPTNYGVHHPHFALDESVMPKGVELHVSLALRALKELAATKM